MELGTARATLDVDVRNGQVTARAAAGLGDGDAARVIAAALVGGVQEGDALGGGRVRRV
jgi:hypothetical protein